MIITLISSFIMVIIAFIIWSDLADTKLNWKSKRLWIYIFATSIMTSINYLNAVTILKVINITLILIITHKFFFRQELKYALIGPMITQMLCFISETIFAVIVLTIFSGDDSTIINTVIGSLVTNIAISTFMLLFSKISITKKIYKKFNLIVSNVDETAVLFMSILAICGYSIFAMNVFYGLDSTILIILSLTITLVLFILVFMYFNAKDDYYKINNKYNSSLLSLKEFELVLSNYRVDNHENRNHLLTIRNMTKNKKITSFIDTILDNKEKDNARIMHETTIIPSGGLRGLVYSKMLVMHNKGIECELDVAKNIRTIELIDYGDDMLLDICKIVGIFLDNAIEEVEKLEDQYTIIEMFTDDDKFIISITNPFDINNDKEDIYRVGYSTKGNKHGYGLSLVKKIVAKNNKLKTHHEINDDEFIQVLEIKK